MAASMQSSRNSKTSFLGALAKLGGPLKPAPAQWTNDPAVLNAGIPSRGGKTPSNVAAAAEYNRVNLKRNGYDPEAEEEYRLIREIRDRKTLLEAEQTSLRQLFRRFDNLYYPEAVVDPGGADHWPLEKQLDGRAHVSVNNIPPYVDIPASLESVVPIEGYVAPETDADEREKVQRIEQLYFQWKDDDEFELKAHRACVTKELYGFTYGRVVWDEIEGRPRTEIIEAPENLYVGWGNSDFTRIDWSIYCYGLSPSAIKEDFGLSVEAIRFGNTDKFFPLVIPGDHADPIASIYADTDKRGRRHSGYEDLQVEVYDYWYKKPVPPTKSGKPRAPEIWNAVYIGNALVKNARHKEYDDIPYIPLPNTYIPRSPYGRSALYDLEQMFREKDERMTNAAQMIQSVVGGQMWQLVGPEAPDDVPAGAIPRPNEVATPGPGNELRALQPFMPHFAIEDYLKRIDQEMEVGSGLNDLLLGRAPQAILGSSKAIAALVANYEARIRMRRDLFYQWRKKMWRQAAKVWEAKDAEVRELIDGRYRIDVRPPELTPRDALENTQRVINLVQNRLMSMERGMDEIGVDNPIDEKSVIREEQTDPALNPAAVQAQATLLAAFQSLGIQPPQAAQQQAANSARTLNRPAAGSQSLNGPENAANPPPESLPANAQPGTAQAQTMLQGGEASGRILTQQDLA